MRAVAVQSLDWDEPLRTEDWLVLSVQPRQCQTFLHLDLEPLPKHVKRVRKAGKEACLVLACRSEPQNSPFRASLAAWIVQSGIPEQEPIEHKVPIIRPKTKQQLEEWNTYWPCQFTEVVPDTRIALSDSERTIFENQMMAVFATAKDQGDDTADAMVCFLFDPNRQIVVGKGISVGGGFDDHGVMQAIQNVAKCSQNPQQLFCTGYTAFCSREPCTMCCMALVHARIATVVFGENSALSGALAGPSMRLGAHPQLNHSFNVYRYTK